MEKMEYLLFKLPFIEHWGLSMAYSMFPHDIKNSPRSEKLFLNFPRRLLSASSIELWVVHPEWSALNNAIIQFN